MHDRKAVTCIVAVSLLFYVLFALASARAELERLRKTAERLSADYSASLAENAELKQRLELGSSADSVEALARDRLGTVWLEETVFYFITYRED